MGNGAAKMARAELATLAKQVEEAQKLFDKVNLYQYKQWEWFAQMIRDNNTHEHTRNKDNGIKPHNFNISTH